MICKYLFSLGILAKQKSFYNKKINEFQLYIYF